MIAEEQFYLAIQTGTLKQVFNASRTFLVAL